MRREDLRLKRFRDRQASTTIFVVDASGSTAMDRLGEAKGAVEMLLADCYVRRDEVALIAFRGAGADLLLPATRSLTRAKRSLAALPGGGGTPLASGLAAAESLAEEVRRKGRTPTLVVITDGRANVGRDGIGGRERAHADAEAAARAIGQRKLKAILIDNSPRPSPRRRASPSAWARSICRCPGWTRHHLGRRPRSWRRGTAGRARMSDSLDFDSDGADWPNRDASRFVTAKGLRFHVQVAGEGPCMLLLHGTGAFDPFVARSAAAVARHFTISPPTCQDMASPAIRA